MRLFLIKILVGLSVFSMALAANDLFIRWDYEPNNKAKAKYAQIDFNACPAEGRAFFIGSSLTNCHINPQIFDSLTGLCSFNLGLNGLTGPQKITLLKSLIAESVIREGDLIFMEYQLYSPIVNSGIKPQLNNTFHQYYYTNESFINDVHYQFSSINNLGSLSEVTWSTFKYLLNSKPKLHYYGGFISEGEGGRFMTTNHQLPKGFFPYKGKRKKKYSGLSESLFQERIDKNKLNKIRILNNDSFSKNTIHSYQELFSLCQAEKLKLFFVIPSTHGNDAMELEVLNSVASSFPRITINLFDPQRFPDLFDSKYYYDLNHYNITGTKIYTNALAQKYLELQ